MGKKQSSGAKMYRNEQGQLVLYVAVHVGFEQLATLQVSGFVLADAGKKLVGRNVLSEVIDLNKDPLTRAELVEAVRNLAQMYALQIGEPDFDIVSNTPLLKQEPIIKMKKEKSNDIFKTF
jgi:hypothetical protein